MNWKRIALILSIFIPGYWLFDTIADSWLIPQPFDYAFIPKTDLGSYDFHHLWERLVVIIIVSAFVLAYERLAANQRNAIREIKKLSHRLIEVQEEERRTIARELHDETGQNLTLLKMKVDQAIKIPPKELVPFFNAVSQDTGEIMDEVRNIALELRPGMLEELGLVAALCSLFERYANKTEIKVEFKNCLESDNFPDKVRIAVYRIIQEALTNVARYAGVKEVEVGLNPDSKALIITIVDKGRGFDLSKSSLRASTGLSSMRERATLLGGEFDIKSAPGSGTSIKVKLPVSRRYKTRP